MKRLIVVGSARGEGNTKRVARRLQQELDADLIDLLDHRIAPYDYAHNYPATDDFLGLMASAVADYDGLILASPVYWYAMSGPMKIFLDRFTDLLTVRKELGRRLRGRTLSVLSCANDDQTYPCFYRPFELSAAYLGMQYGPAWHGWVAVGEVHLVTV